MSQESIKDNPGHAMTRAEYDEMIRFVDSLEIPGAQVIEVRVEDLKK